MDLALLLLRCVVGFTFFGHGTQKLWGWFGGEGLKKTTELFRTLNIQPARLMASVSALAEVLSGLFFMLGFLTNLSAGVIVVTMLVAILTVSGKKGYWSPEGGAEYNVLIIAVCIAVILTGPGTYALDPLLF
ncbi:DoxX family protein [Pisciglobus halotolerans]|uniref:Putative oxidoreductase n=1 Tax=Pisciglobus halotolerans TaxID=745365 RepID=A0A1I3AWG3_9LACT|nr:DoxX family protein [Pisciglobus halotolerans]SFH54407.1 putative oxidoreductase [Pisciglobus halotolerans]